MANKKYNWDKLQHEFNKFLAKHPEKTLKEFSRFKKISFGVMRNHVKMTKALQVNNKIKQENQEKIEQEIKKIQVDQAKKKSLELNDLLMICDDSIVWNVKAGMKLSLKDAINLKADIMDKSGLLKPVADENAKEFQNRFLDWLNKKPEINIMVNTEIKQEND